MSKLQDSIKLIEKLSLVSCSKEVYQLLERALYNVEPITRVDTKGWSRLLWQNEIDISRLRDDKPGIRLTSRDLKKNAPGFFEDYISVGPPPKTSTR